jgi:hypothetical protein
MPWTNPDSSFGEQAGRVYSLYQRIADIRDRHGGKESDARRANLNNIMMAANAAMATLRLLEWAKREGEAVLVQALGLAKPEYINPVAEDLLRSSRLFLLIESQFQIETLFRNILLAAGRLADKQGFYNISKDVLAFAVLPDEAAKLRVLNVTALMRNSMHSNGVHHGWKGTGTLETIDGIEFRFEHGKRVQCGSWYHIVTALTASIEIVNKVLSAGPVASIAEIPDRYSQQKASGGI